MKEFWWFFFASIGVMTIILGIPTALDLYVAQRLKQPNESPPAPDQSKELADLEVIEQQGDISYAAQNYDHALKFYKQGQEICKKMSWTDAWNVFCSKIALCHMTKGEFELGIVYLSNSSLKYSDFYHRAICHYVLENHPECIADCIEVGRQNPVFAASLWVRGLARLKTGDRSMALDDFKKAATLDRKHGIDYGEDHHGYFFRGLAYARLKKSKRAEEDLKLAHELAIALKDDFFKNKSEQLLDEI